LSTDFITATQVKSYLGITSTDYDTILATLCLAGKKKIYNLCNRPDGFFTGTWTQVNDGEQADRLVLTNTPITSITSISLIGYGGASTAIDSSTYTFNPLNGVVGFRDSVQGRFYNGWPSPGRDYAPMDGWRTGSENFGYGFRNVSTVYVGGYTNDAALPEDLVQGATEYVAWMFRMRTRDPSLKSENLGHYGYTNADGASLAAAFQDYIVTTYLRDYIRHIVTV